MLVDILGTYKLRQAEAWFSIALRPRKPEGSLGRIAQDGHLDSHTAPELCVRDTGEVLRFYMVVTGAAASAGRERTSTRIALTTEAMLSAPPRPRRAPGLTGKDPMIRLIIGRARCVLRTKSKGWQAGYCSPLPPPPPPPPTAWASVRGDLFAASVNTHCLLRLTAVTNCRISDSQSTARF